jgi:D-alanyl-D-alanine carboxypeptidase/D-alanyl-D-alanine-endopeptidase (penicillin-binding protein 4)
MIAVVASPGGINFRADQERAPTMLKFSGPTFAALGLLLALGACAGGALPPAAPSLAVTAPAGGEIATDRAAPQGASVQDSLANLKGEPEPAEAASDAPELGSDAPVEAPALAPASAPADRAAAAAEHDQGTAVGYLLLDLESGRELAAFNPDLPLIPASTTKLATAIVALDVLGPEHRFRTELLIRGAVRDGVLEGDLVLRGGGDPALDVADLLELALQLERSGIRQIQGAFLIDDSALPRRSEIEPSQPLEAAYNPGIGALSLAFNRVQLRWRGGATVDAETLPPLDEVHFEGVPPAQLPPGGVELGQSGADGVVWRVADRGPRRQERSLPVKDPGLHAGRVFWRLALAQNVVLPAPGRGTTPPGASLLAVHESAPLRDLLHDTLLYSNNMMAEMIGLSTARRLGQASASLDADGRLLLQRLGQLIPEVDWRSAVLPNSSGLDGSARLTPRQLAAIARYGWQKDLLPALLPAGGWSGTLVRRFDDPEEALRVWAKTGAVNYGSALAGFLFSTNGRPAVFATMVSDTAARAAYDALARPDRADEAAAGVWNARARALQDRLVESWLNPPATS